jgi:hypothetical protein
MSTDHLADRELALLDVSDLSAPYPDDPALAGLVRRRERTRTAWLQLPETVVRDPRGGADTLRHLSAAMDGIRDRIEHDPEDQRHRRISRWSRLLVHGLPVLDGLILFWFLAGVLNADLRRVDVLTAVAAGLALLASLALALWSRNVGEHLQGFADRRGALIWRALDGTALLMLAVSVVVWSLVAAMMVVRVRDEVFQATGELGRDGTLIGIVLGAALVVLNATVLHLAFADGSPDTRDLDRLARVVLPQRRRQERLARRFAAQTVTLRTRTAARSAVRRP